MKIKEVCRQTGLTDKAVRHYIKNGIVFPNYSENYSGRKNYNFSSSDVERLKEIALLRKYGFSIENIRAMVTDKEPVGKIVEVHISEMKCATDDNVKIINELMTASRSNPKTISDLCRELNNTTYVPPSVAPQDDAVIFKDLYGIMLRDNKIKNVSIAILSLLLIVSIIGFICATWGGLDIVTNVSEYDSVFGYGGLYYSAFENNNIFPKEIPESAEVEKFSFIRYNPYFDDNYLCELVYSCSEDEYKAEYERLKAINSTNDYNIYGITGFDYELCAILASEYNGVVYALTDRESQTFIYIAIEFYNFYTDIDYDIVVESDYLPQGFDAKYDENADYGT
ncbi:MAG: MerR family transcriptional regulator [Clostridiales bacterium]|nr:MerR family transcriptional regulator [Clostridiales bacterium]